MRHRALAAGSFEGLLSPSLPLSSSPTRIACNVDQEKRT
jgi:hypothetical protein